MVRVQTIEFDDCNREVPPRLATNDAHVWVVPLDEGQPDRLHNLSPAERARASRFTSTTARLRFIQRRCALRAILSRYTGMPPQAITFNQNAYGKPALNTSSNLVFSVSHSESLALVALARDALIGADIEHVRPAVGDMALVERFFTRNEADSLARLNSADRIAAFFNAWTRKEAIVKAIGCGLSIPLDTFEVTMRPGEPPAVVAWNVPAVEPRKWHLFHFEPRSGYVAALAVAAH